MTDLEAVPALAAVPAPSKNAGSQTLDRGIRALVMVAAAPGGMTIQEVADRLAVHRTIAHRLLGTLADHHLIARGPDNRFRAGGGLMALIDEQGVDEFSFRSVLVAALGAVLLLLVLQAIAARRRR